MKGSNSTISAWENFDDNAMNVMCVEGRANHPTRYFFYDLANEEFGQHHFTWLDIGVVGMVDYGKLMGKQNFTFTGVDISQSIVEDSRKYLRQEGDRILLWNVENPIEEAEEPLGLGGFDLITARHILNHCNYYESPLQNIHRLLSDQGLCVIVFHLHLIEGEDRLHSHESWSMPGKVIGNHYGRDKFFSYLLRDFQVQRFIRFDDGYKPNDVILARKRWPGAEASPLPAMEVRRRPHNLKSLIAGKLPPELKRKLKVTCCAGKRTRLEQP